MNNRPFLRSAEYRWQLDPANPKRPIKGTALKSLKDFLTLKRQNPMASYGSSDKPFQPKGNFGTKIPRISHAHITHDTSIVYRVVDNTIYLYGFYTHDELGTGQPDNKLRQKSMATRFSNMKFSE